MKRNKILTLVMRHSRTAGRPANAVHKMLWKRAAAFVTAMGMAVGVLTVLPEGCLLEFGILASAEETGVAIDATNFPDETFRNYVLANFDTDSSNTLSQTEMDAATQIFVWGTAEEPGTVADLTGIAYFKNLTLLACDYCNLTTLDLSNNTALISLICQSNQLSNLDVSKNTALIQLSCANNQLTSLDVSKNTALTELGCAGNQLTSLDVSNNTALTKLQCSGNQLTSLDVSKNTALTELICMNNQLSSLDVSNNTALEYFFCDNNQLSNLDVSLNTSLFTFSCSFNQLTYLDVSKNTQLINLGCHGNQLTSLDLSKNTSVYFGFGCSDNSYNIGEVTGSYDLSNLPAGFDASKASNWTGAEYDAETNSLINFTDTTVTYDYDHGNSDATDCDHGGSNTTTVKFRLTLTYKPHEHSYGTEWNSDETSHWHVCECGEKADIAEHTAGDWIIDKEATVSEAGSKHKECTVCGYVLETAEIEKLHSHEFGTEWKSDETSHWHVCSCGEKTDIAEHTAGDWITDKEATPLESGSKHKECTVCGAVIEESIIDKIEDDSLFDDSISDTETVEKDPKADPSDSITSITIHPAFNMKHKDGDDVELDLTNIKIKAKEIYNDEEKIAKAEEALGIDVSPNKHYNLLDLTLWQGDTDISNSYEGLVKVIIPIPTGHLDKNFSVYRLTEKNGKMEKEIIPSVREGNNVVIYLEHFSVYALVADSSHVHSFGSGFSYDASNHWHECSCGEKADIAGHVSDGGKVTVQPTATSTGVRTYSCSVCGYVMRTETIPATGGGNPTYPSYTTTDTTTSTTTTTPSETDKLTVKATTNGDKVTLKWNEIKGAKSYTVYQYKDGKYVKIKDTTKTTVTFKSMKNGKTYKFLVKYTKNDKLCSTSKSGKVSVTAYYKPIAKATATENSVRLKWEAVPEAEKYAVYKYVNGKAVKLAETEKTAVRITKLKSDTEYEYIVRAYVDGEWTTMKKSDIVTVKTN